MIRTIDGFKMRLETLGAQGVLLSIDDAPNSNRFNRTVEVLVTLPAPGVFDNTKVELNIAGAISITIDEANDRRRALELGIFLMPALHSYAATVLAALQFAHPDEYGPLADQALERVLKIADIPTR